MSVQNSKLALKAHGLRLTWARLLIAIFILVTGLSRSAEAQDVTGDGVPDVVAGVPGKNVAGGGGEGQVSTIPGAGLGGGGLGMANALLDQNLLGGPGGPQPGDQFGLSVVIGDFNSDGIFDRVIGVPFEDLGGVADAGGFHIVYGAGALPSLFLRQGIAPLVGVPQAGDQFGFALATGDFNADNYEDLAIGAPGETLPGAPAGHGVVHVLYGNPAGLVAGGLVQVVHQGIPGILGNLAVADGFGSVLATGDFDGNGADDLVIGIPNKDTGAPVVLNSGAVQVIYSLPGVGLTLMDQLFTQSGVLGPAAANDQFGFSLATGDLLNDGGDDLVIGVPFKDVVPGGINAGMIRIILSVGGPLAPAVNVMRTRNNPAIPGVAVGGDLFGYAVACGDFNFPADPNDDIAIGVPGDDTLAVDAGLVIAIYPGGPAPIAFDQALTGGIALAGDQFGWSLAVSDFDLNLAEDLVIGCPYDAVGGVVCGSISLIPGAVGGLGTGPAPQWIDQNALTFGANQPNDLFGWVVASHR
jgi:hypothetical protein